MNLYSAEIETASLLRAIRAALAAKPHWSVFRLDLLPSGQLVFHDHREDDDFSKEIRIEYRPSLDAAATVVAVFTESHEEDANEGLHDLISTAYNLMKWLGSQVPDISPRLPSGQNDDAFVISRHGRPTETVQGAWQFNRGA